MYDTTEILCGWRIDDIDDSVCVAPSWHDGAHIMVPAHELEASA